MYTIRFDLAGLRKANDKVFLTCDYRTYGALGTIFHRNDFHTTVKIDNETFHKHFKYESFTGIYRNITRITWDEMKKIATVETRSLVA